MQAITLIHPEGQVINEMVDESQIGDMVMANECTPEQHASAWYKWRTGFLFLPARNWMPVTTA